MKRLLVILISLQILTGNALGQELAKIPFLIQHYFYHTRSETPDISVADFLKLHYGDKAHRNADMEHHKSLPLQKSQETLSNQVLVLLPADFGVFPAHPASKIFVENWYKLNLAEDFCIGQDLIFAIFQPPRTS